MKKDIDELRDELSEVRMQTVNMLRSLDLRQCIFGPREFEV
jgi:hypothetical protein